MQDILLDENNDIEIRNGDFVIGESTKQEIETILISFRGEFKEFPTVGTEIERLVKARKGITTMKSVIRGQLETDGLKKVTITNGSEGITVNAQRNGTEQR